LKITADTDILVRAMAGDDLHQTAVAESALADAELVAVTGSVLCELVWVVCRGYKIPASDVSAWIWRLVQSGNVVADLQVVEAGLAMLDAGGDFADGVIAYQGKMLGASTFASFDRQAVRLMKRRGEPANLLV
jgi:predicted nucleic-acid-binding protein